MKIGIVSHYHNSLNCGGNLQAYALCQVLRNKHIEAEQICLQEKYMRLPWAQQSRPLTAAQLFRKAVHRGEQIMQKTADKLLPKDLLQRRKEAFRFFNKERIPHSAEVYDYETISRCADSYDAFITGSDQVWNLRWYNPAYFLTFVPDHKPKFSYGASLALREMTENEKNLMQDHLEDFSCISVREMQAVEQLEQVLGREITWVLDPALLLTKEQWDEVCASRIVKENYLFCYFLDKASGARRLAGKYAKQKNLKVVTIPHLNGVFMPEDVRFGDIRLDAPSPEEFISLIKYADCVFTDSFHATAFSAIYQREYFVFPRSSSREMDDRIYSLTGLLGSAERFCDTKEKKQLSYLFSCASLEHARTEAMALAQRRSREYLEKCLETAEAWMRNHET